MGLYMLNALFVAAREAINTKIYALDSGGVCLVAFFPSTQLAAHWECEECGESCKCK